ncbi:MAG: DUF411 domain-containing protein [Gemmatimonadaceae bacterium]
MRHIVGLAVVTAFALGACTKGDEQPATAVASPAEAPPVTVASNASATSATGIPIKVYKDPNCGCCKEWVKHLEQNGFVVETMDMPDLSAVKDKYGVKPDMQACHTAVVGGYTIEGHVPADVIMKLLKEKPSIAGLAVPGMPMGSPGMEGATKEKYDILTFDRAGRTTVYAQR